MSFAEAKSRVEDSSKVVFPSQEKEVIYVPTMTWEERASSFVKGVHQRLLIEPKALAFVQKRGFSMETIRRYRIGWNPLSLFPRREEWGLEKCVKDGKEKKLLLPPGVVIPCFQKDHLYKVKIRRSDWREGSSFGKYYIIPGGVDSIPILGDTSHLVTVIVESEFDAMLVIQEAGDLCSCMSLGGAQKRPSEALRGWLNERKLLLFALDFDESGKKEYYWWKNTCPNVEPWPVPKEKSPGNYFVKGGDLKAWIFAGIKNIMGNREERL
jgi:hypothetical protein